MTTVYVMSLATIAEWEAECGDPSVFEGGAESMASPQFVGVFSDSAVAMAKGMEEAEALVRECLTSDALLRWTFDSDETPPQYGRPWWKASVYGTDDDTDTPLAYVVVQKTAVQ